jgi:hypothetical protein
MSIPHIRINAGPRMICIMRLHSQNRTVKFVSIRLVTRHVRIFFLRHRATENNLSPIDGVCLDHYLAWSEGMLTERHTFLHGIISSICFIGTLISLTILA